MSDRRDLLVAFALALLSLLVFLGYWDYGINDDEGYLLGGVIRVLDGEVLYRDFHHTYAPGGFYLVALLFRVFGEDLLVLRALWLVLRVSIVVLAYLAGRRILPRTGAAAAALLFVAAPGPWHKSFFHFFLLANALVLTGLRGRGTRAVAGAGLLAGVTFLFRQDLGVFVAAAYALLFLLRRRSREDGKRALAFFLFAALPLIACGIYFVQEGALGIAVRKILFAGMRDNQTNDLPFPPLLHPLTGGWTGLAFGAIRLLYYLPVPLAIGAGAFAWKRLRKGDDGLPLLVYSFLGLLSFHQAIWRSDLAHLLQAVGLSYLLLPWAVYALVPRPALLRPLLALLLPPVLYLAMAGYGAVYRAPAGLARIAAEGLQAIPPYYTGSYAQIGGEDVRLAIPRARVRTSPEEAGFLETLRAVLDRYSSPGDYILTVPGLQMIYFLFDRANPTAYVHLRRALDSREEEDRYIHDLLDRPTRLVLLRDVPLDGREERRFRRFAPRVFEAIEGSFDRVEKIGDLDVYRRKENSP
jgi:hypothetical protein